MKIAEYIEFYYNMDKSYEPEYAYDIKNKQWTASKDRLITKKPIPTI